MRLAGKKAVVTAAAAGIGRAVAEAFAREGARVFACDVNDAGLADLNAEAVRLDVTDRSAVAALPGRTGPVDVLFNGAGVVHDGAILACSEDDWAFAFELNVTAMYRMIRTYLPGAPALGVGGIRYTARCAFCTSANVVWAPDKLPWFGGRGRASGQNRDWYYAAKGVVHPEAVLQLAWERGALALVFSENEPALSVEYTLDVARLAKAEGLRVVLYSNGFSEPAVVRKLAPHVDAVDLGIKGSLDPDFYARLMRSPGATEAVKRSLLEWHAAGVHLRVSDLIAKHI